MNALKQLAMMVQEGYSLHIWPYEHGIQIKITKNFSNGVTISSKRIIDFYTANYHIANDAVLVTVLEEIRSEMEQFYGTPR